jgi:hypothetical protein
VALKGPDHYRQAENLLEKARFERNAATKAEQLAEAQVHATLALLAAVVHSGQTSKDELQKWTIQGLNI